MQLMLSGGAERESATNLATQTSHDDEWRSAPRSQGCEVRAFFNELDTGVTRKFPVQDSVFR